VSRLVAQLQAIGLAISTRQVMRLLIEGQQGFLIADLHERAWAAQDFEKCGRKCREVDRSGDISALVVHRPP
jgi:hypothetical protein